MERAIQGEIEAKLNKVWLYIYTQKEYEEDYQMPMLKSNQITGILPVDGCTVETKYRYSYDISGLTSLKTLYEKKRMKKQDIQGIIADLLRTADALRQYMLNPDCILLQPEYIFCKDHRHYFCYLPDIGRTMNKAFHELSEYFVKMLDYEDTEGIFLAYELHKATLQEHYNLSGIMREYETHEKERKAELKEKERTKSEQSEENYGNIFTLTEEDGFEETPKYEKQSRSQKRYEPSMETDVVREKNSWRPTLQKAIRHLPGKRWGQWGDLILETDKPERKP